MKGERVSTWRFTKSSMSVILKESVALRGQSINPWIGFYFLQSLLINFALGYELSTQSAQVETTAYSTLNS